MKKYFSFKGRITEGEYFISLLCYIFVSLPLSVIIFEFQNPIILVIIYILSVWFILSQSAKRCHDIGISGWWQFIPLMPIYLLLAYGNIGDNKYGNDPKGRIKKDKSSDSLELERWHNVKGDGDDFLFKESTD